MEFSKKSLVKIMEEVDSMDVEEMALRKSGKQDIRRNPKTNEIIYPKFVAGWHPDNPTKIGEDGIPDYWVVNPTQTEGSEILAVPLDCEELNEFMEKHKDWLEQLRLEHKLEPQIIACTRGKYHRPVEKALAGGYKPSGEQYDEKESILRKLNPIIDRYFIDNSEMEKILETRSIPTISRDRKHLDAYGEISNNKIEWGTHSYNSYKTSSDFKKAISDRIKYATGRSEDLPDNFKSQYLARQFNLIYQNWESTKKYKQEYKGKTSRYVLDRFGLETDNLDVAVRLDFRINGKLNADQKTYKWDVSMNIKFGKKLSEEFRISGLKETQVITSSKEVDIDLSDPYTTFDNKYTVLDNPSILQGLIEAFDDLKNQIQSLKPNYMLGVATATRLDVPESKMEVLRNKIVQEIKK